MKATLKTRNACGRTARKDLARAVESTVVPPATHDMIAQRTYEIWQRHGCPSGTSFHDWLAAEAELRSAHHEWLAAEAARSARRHGRRERRQGAGLTIGAARP